MNDEFIEHPQQVSPAIPPDPIVLIYIGNAEGHGYHIEGVPACDLTQEMIDASGYTATQLLAFNGPVYAPVKE